MGLRARVLGVLDAAQRATGKPWDRASERARQIRALPVTLLSPAAKDIYANAALAGEDVYLYTSAGGPPYTINLWDGSRRIELGESDEYIERI